MGGKIQPIGCETVLYLGPILERRNFDVTVAAVAHELTHILLEHALFTTPAQYSAQEDEAWAKVRDWGFEDEERAHVLFYQRYHSRERRKIAVLEREVRH